MTDKVDELSDFKILAVKVNNDNKNKKKKLDETKEVPEICKKKNIKNYILNMKISTKKNDNLVTKYNRTRKTKLIWAKKRKIFIPQVFEETESEKSDEKNEEEERTEEESEVNEVIPKKK